MLLMGYWGTSVRCGCRFVVGSSPGTQGGKNTQISYSLANYFFKLIGSQTRGMKRLDRFTVHLVVVGGFFCSVQAEKCGEIKVESVSILL